VRAFLIIIALTLNISVIKAEEIIVGLEPFPPLINEDGTGYVISLLKGLSLQSNYTFNIKIMTYARAKVELRKSQIDLIGLTPKNIETIDFYQYADELQWSISTTLDIFSTSNQFKKFELLKGELIGTLIGNADFFAQQFNIPSENLIEVRSLEQLAKMLVAGRIDYVIFERLAMMTTIKKLAINNIYHQKLKTLPASLAVSKTLKGQALKVKLDSLLANIDEEEYLAQYHKLNNIKQSGKVLLKEKAH